MVYRVVTSLNVVYKHLYIRILTENADFMITQYTSKCL